MQVQMYNPALHRLALLTTAATFPLIFMGGLVTSHGAGMSVPDWPNSYGYNMFTFPPSKWVGGIFYEHTHRLMGAVVGMLSIALTVCAWKVEPRRWVRWLAAGVLGAVIVQGVLGGLRVVMVELDLAIVHACLAQAFFCLAALTTITTSRWWIEAPEQVPHWVEADAMHRLFTLSAIAVGLIYLQLIIGAVMRHYEAGLAIPDFPLSYGHVLPPATPEHLADANRQRAFEMQLPPVTQGQVWLHFAHRLGAIAVSIAVIAGVTIALRQRRRTRWEPIVGAFLAAVAGLLGLGAAYAVGSTRGWLAGIPVFSTSVVAVFVLRAFLRRMRDARPILAPAVLAAALLLIQLTLGILTVVLRKPADIASAHVAMGALALVTTFTLTVRAARTSALATASCKAAGSAGDTSDHNSTSTAHPSEREPVLAA